MSACVLSVGASVRQTGQVWNKGTVKFLKLGTPKINPITAQNQTEANWVDPDESAACSFGGSLNWICTDCSNLLLVWKLIIISMVPITNYTSYIFIAIHTFCLVKLMLESWPKKNLSMSCCLSDWACCCHVIPLKLSNNLPLRTCLGHLTPLLFHLSQMET